MNKEQILRAIDKHAIVCGVVGLGYVGLPLAVEISKAGYSVIGFDVVTEKVDLLNEGVNYISDVDDNELSSAVSEKRLRATADFNRIAECGFIAICVPTPLDSHQQPDSSFMEAAAKSVAPNMSSGSMIVLESTSYPGTTEELIKPILEEGSGLVCEDQFYLGFSPERVDPGNEVYKTGNTPKVVGAIGADALDCIASFYESVIAGGVMRVSSPAVAEMEKILENTYRNVNIGLVNEMAKLCDGMGINVWEVIEAAKSKPYGFTAFYPGPGLGGHCIPLDPYYLTWKAREYGFHTSMIEASMTVNDSMPEWCASRAARILNESQIAPNGANILVLGVAYKANINDYRESPSLRLIDRLEKRGCKVEYYDPWVPFCRHNGIERHSLPLLTEQIVGAADLVIVACGHANVDYEFVQKHAKSVFDTCNAMVGIEVRDNIELL